MTLSGQVVIKRGSINIHADKVIISRPDSKDGHEVMESYGTPVTFYQLQNDGKPVRGHALKIRYESANDLVILMGNAYLEQLGSNMMGGRIIYFLKKQQMQAFSENGKRVTTVLVPTQLQDKDGENHH